MLPQLQRPPLLCAAARPAAPTAALLPAVPGPQNAAVVFILPYLGILWKEQGFTGSQIGVLSAVRPFICSISGGCCCAAARPLLPLPLPPWCRAHTPYVPTEAV